jgi:hypothetical protein
MSTPILQANVPLVNVPFVDMKTGMITESWFLFLIQLWQRTGGSSGGGTSTGITLADVLGIEETFAPVVSKDKSLAFEETFSPFQVNSKICEMIFAPLVGLTSVLDTSYASGTGFTPNVTSTLTLPASFSSATRLWIFFDSAFQGDDQYSLSGTTLTFTSAIPAGVNKVYVKGLM